MTDQELLNSLADIVVELLQRALNMGNPAVALAVSEKYQAMQIRFGVTCYWPPLTVQFFACPVDETKPPFEIARIEDESGRTFKFEPLPPPSDSIN